jgi:hypothetical protein
MALYLPPSLKLTLEKQTFSTWVDHVPFAYDLVEALRPETVVELGTETGLSYFTFCQSVRDHGLSTRCFAVDTWKGDDHTGPYAERVYEDVRAHNLTEYESFSTLLRMTFAEAVDRFQEDSIDLLHIDGYHTYDAVRGDFESWLPKVRPGGIVLFHDVVARLRDFGAWRCWQELEKTHDTFLFNHGYGLGVLRKEGSREPDADLLTLLFSGDPALRSRLRAFYVHSSEHYTYRNQHARLQRIGGQGRGGGHE